MKLHHNIKCIPGFIFKVCKKHWGQQAGKEQAYGGPVDSGRMNLSRADVGREDNSWEEAAQPRTESCCCTTHRPRRPGPRATSQAGREYVLTEPRDRASQKNASYHLPDEDASASSSPDVFCKYFLSSRR